MLSTAKINPQPFPWRSSEVYKPLILGAIVIVVFQSIFVIASFSEGTGFIDPDAYMRLHRVQTLHEHGDWFDRRISRINPPEGHVQHWTRPFDAIVFAGAWVGSFFVGFDQALSGWALAVNPILQVLTLAALFWMIWPALGSRAFDILSLVFITQLSLINAFVAIRPDHQGLIFFLYILILGFAGRLLLWPMNRLLCYGAGLTAALAMWVSVEAIFVILFVYVTLGLVWLSGDNAISKKAEHFSFGLVTGLIIALLLEQGSKDLLMPMLDQNSILFICLFALVWLFWVLAGSLTRAHLQLQTVAAKIILALAGGGAIALIMNAIEPDFFLGPIKDVDEFYRQTRNRISESRPIISNELLASPEWLEHLFKSLMHVGILFIAVPITVFQLLRLRNEPMAKWWLLLFVVETYYLYRGFSHRWLPYLIIIASPVYAVALHWLITKMRTVGGVHSLSNRVLPVTALIIGLSWVYLPLAGLKVSAEPEPQQLAADQPKKERAKRCPIALLEPVLNDPAGLGKDSKRIVARVDFGSELLYRTKHSVYSIPNHRYQSGYASTFKAMIAETDAEALQIFEEINADLILLCVLSKDNESTSNPGEVNTFRQRLINGELPSWISALQLPDELEGIFLLFRIQRSNG